MKISASHSWKEMIIEYCIQFFISSMNNKSTHNTRYCMYKKYKTVTLELECNIRYQVEIYNVGRKKIRNCICTRQTPWKIRLEMRPLHHFPHATIKIVQSLEDEALHVYFLRFFSIFHLVFPYHLTIKVFWSIRDN